MNRRNYYFTFLLLLLLSFGSLLFLNKGKFSKFVVLVKGEEDVEIIEDLTDTEEGFLENKEEEVETTEEIVEPILDDKTESKTEEENVGTVKTDNTVESKEVSEENMLGVLPDENQIADVKLFSPSLKSLGAGINATPTFRIEFRVYNRNLGTLSVEEALSASNITLLENNIPFPLDFVSAGDYYVATPSVTVGPEYNFGNFAKIDGYNLYMQCYDASRPWIKLRFPAIFKSTDNFKCTVTYIDWLYNLGVMKVLVDDDGNDVLLKAEDEIDYFIASLVDLKDNRVYTDTMTCGSEDDPFSLKTATFKNLSSSQGYVLTELPKDGYRFLGCTKILCVAPASMGDLPPLFKELRFDLSDFQGGDDCFSSCYNQIISQSYLEVVKSNDSLKDGIRPDSDVGFVLTVTAPSDNKDGNFVSKNVIVYDKTSPGFTYKTGTWKVTSSRRGILNIPEPLYNDTDWAQWSIGDMVEGEIVTLEYIAHASADLQPGVYEDIAYVKGVSIVGNEVLGNVSTGSTSEFVGTEVKILGATVSSDSNISESTVSLPKTGANSYLTLLGLLSFIFGLGVLIKDRKLCFN